MVIKEIVPYGLLYEQKCVPLGYVHLCHRRIFWGGEGWWQVRLLAGVEWGQCHDPAVLLDPNPITRKPWVSTRLLRFAPLIEI